VTPARPGHRLFARYAHAPNARGFCGPAAAAGLQSVACGRGDPAVIEHHAPQFSGAWPYQVLIGEFAGADPLDERVGRAYWTGNELTTSIDALECGRRLLTRFAGTARHYWSHLDDSLLAEFTPTHIFHVLGVYPWTRLLAPDRPEPLQVLDSCRIRVGEVVAVSPTHLDVIVDSLDYREGLLHLRAPQLERVGWRTPEGTFLDDPQVGDMVSVHWDFACDRLTDDETRALLHLTRRQLRLTNLRLSRRAG
jgi:hypothetical protein